MARRLDRILVVDLESTCWEKDPPPDETSDIIEIGLAVLDARVLEVVETRSFFVRPERSRVSEFCTRLTTIRPEDVAGAPSLAEACEILRREYDSRNRLWASHGDYDRLQFERCCSALGVPYPFGPTHLNVKPLAALALGSGREIGMARALERLDLTLEGTHHRGVDDAGNIARILGRLLSSLRGGLAT